MHHGRNEEQTDTIIGKEGAHGKGGEPDVPEAPARMLLDGILNQPHHFLCLRLGHEEEVNDHNSRYVR